MTQTAGQIHSSAKYDTCHEGKTPDPFTELVRGQMFDGCCGIVPEADSSFVVSQRLTVLARQVIVRAHPVLACTTDVVWSSSGPEGPSGPGALESWYVAVPNFAKAV